MKLYVPVYFLTLLLSALLLFAVQPMYSKMILPLLGGTPQTWNTAMLFFQTCLLAGYGYAHGTTRFLSTRLQAILHIILLLAFATVLPTAIPDGWAPPAGEDPTLWQLHLMLVTIGGPFFVISASAPMLQKWFSLSAHKDAENPYFLYGASNLGSMSSLLMYPVLIEPLFTLTQQNYYWMLGYFVLIGQTILCAGLLWKYKSIETSVSTQDVQADDEHITAKRRAYWVILALIPSSLMLGVTTYITTDIASAPLLWVMPLALYIGTFIIVFARTEIINQKTARLLGTIAVASIIIERMISNETLSPSILIALHFTAFFFVALACHKILADNKPKASHLTEFYLIMSFGGALGGFFNSIIAPQFFSIPIEYPIMLLFALVAIYKKDMLVFKKTADIQTDGTHAQTKDNLDFNTLAIAGICLFTGLAAPFIGDTTIKLSLAAVCIVTLLTITNIKKPFLFTAGALIIVAPTVKSLGLDNAGNVQFITRNFFGVIKVMDYEQERVMIHGTTNHGTQPKVEGLELTPVSYYYDNHSPISDVLNYFAAFEGQQNVAVMGLGIGVTACYTKEGRFYDFYEIDRHVAELAENKEFFTYLSDCGSPYEIILGDARLKVMEQPDQKYDLVIVDTFSSDNIPIHMMTKEAIELFMSKIKDDGVLLLHISNNYIDLEPVLAMISENTGIPSLAKVVGAKKIEDTELQALASHFVLFTKDQTNISHFEEHGWSTSRKRKNVKMWTDKYSNIIAVFGINTAMERLQEKLKEQNANDMSNKVEEKTE